MQSKNFAFSNNRKPNVIWVLTDQMRAQAMSFMGDKNVRTPNLDNLAREGVVFQNAVSGSPWCTPFRGSLITGQYPHKNGAFKTPSALDPSIPTITAPLKEAGYHTAYVGKWHLDGSNDPTHYIPPERRGGFDYFMGNECNNNKNQIYIFGTDCETPTRLKGYETDSLTDLFIDHISKHVGEKEDYQPFFGVLSVQPSHNPYTPPTDVTGERKYYHHPEDITLRPNVPPGKWAEEAKLNLAGYYGMIENIDTNIGRLRMALRDLDIDRDTYIIFTSDHGDCVNSHGQWFKSSPWEESIRIPFIVCGAGEEYQIKKENTTAMLNHVDIAPTTLGLCGIETPEEMVGYDYSALCLEKGVPEYRENEKTMPTSAYLQQIPRKYHEHSINKPWRGVVTEDGWKYVCLPNTDYLLFNLNDDPYEMANLCFDMSYQDQKERLHNMLKKHIEETDDCFELPNIELT